MTHLSSEKKTAQLCFFFVFFVSLKVSADDLRKGEEPLCTHPADRLWSTSPANESAARAYSASYP